MAKAIIIEEKNMLNNQTLETLRRLRLTGAVGPGSANPSRNKSKKPTIQTSTETAVDRAPPLLATELGGAAQACI